jgi:predicted porin
MKLRTTAAAALCTITTMATAQSTVTLYGTLDIGVSNQSTLAPGYSATVPGQTASLGSVTRVQDGGVGGSNFGFRGSEDMGGGNKANFQLQGNVAVNTGGTAGTSGAISPPGPALFNQIAMVGFSGGWGEVKIGRQIAPMYYAMASTDPREARYYGSILGALVGVNSSAGWAGVSTNAPLGAIYDDNSVVYTTPKFGGVTGNLQYTVGGIAGNTSAASRKSATLMYAVGNLKLSAVYYAANDAYTVPTRANGTNNNRWLHLGAQYNMKDFTVSGSWSNAKNPSGTPSGVGVLSAANPALGNTVANANYDITSIGLGYKISPQYRLTSGYYRITDKTVSANRSSLVSVGLDIYLSKRSMLYVQGGRVSNQGSMNQALVYGSPVAGGQSTTGYMVGVRHSF